MTDNGTRSPEAAGMQTGGEAMEDIGQAGEAAVLAEESEVERLRAENAELRDRLLRAMAETDNVRKRGERERAEATLYAASNFARDLLNVPDSLARALAVVPPEQRETADEVTRNLLAGIEVTEREVQNVFSRHNIRKVDPKGQKFDPHFHQAMFEVPNEAVPPGTVVEVVQPGYAIGERCLRPAMVGVSKAG